MVLDTLDMQLEKVSVDKDLLAPGHRLCAGCAEPIAIRQILHAIGEPVIVGSSTGCVEVTTTPFPFSSWRVPWIHSAFENVSSTICGAEAMYRSLVRQGKMKDEGIKFVCFAGDGATYDIGLQWISGCMERGHKFVYVCLNNEAYMNTGIQRSSATPFGAWTTTSPDGKASFGKKVHRKDVTAIMADHNIPYVAQVSPHAWRDMMEKAKKAADCGGPAYLNALVPCQRGWRYPGEKTVEVCRLAVDTCVWPLYEVVDGEYHLTYNPNPKRPVKDWLSSQGRFKHLMTPENAPIIDQMQTWVDLQWDRLLERCKV